MAKKYQTIETKIHWLTWTIMGVIAALLIGLVIIVQPSAKETFYNSYKNVTTEVNFDKKLPKDNNFVLLEGLEDGFLGINKGLFSLGARDNHVTIVFFGSPSDAASATQIANVYARLYGSDSMDPAIATSDLKNELGDNVTLYYLEQKVAKFSDTVDQLNARYEDADIVANALPMVLVLFNNQVVDYAVLTEANVPLQLLNFYNGVLESDAIQDFLN